MPGRRGVHGKSALQADAAPTSHPILERLRLVVAASTSLYVWGPADPPHRDGPES
jgi:hypothetical protein